MNRHYLKQLPLSWNDHTDASTPDAVFLGKSGDNAVLAFSYLMVPEESTEWHRLEHGSVKLGQTSKRLFEISAPIPGGPAVWGNWLRAFRDVLKDANDNSKRLKWKERGRYADALAMIHSKLRDTAIDDTTVSAVGARSQSDQQSTV